MSGFRVASELVSVIGKAVFYVVTFAVLLGWARGSESTGSRAFVSVLLVIATMLFIRSVAPSLRRLRSHRSRPSSTS